MSNAASVELDERNIPDIPTQEQIGLRPWKYIGYKGFSEFLASDDDFFILRRFDKLAARLALVLQDRVSEIEEQLERLDQQYSMPTASVNNGTCRDEDSARKSLLVSVQENLTKYYEFVALISNMKTQPRASFGNVQKVQTWLSNYRGAIDAEEVRFIDHNDLLAPYSKRKPKVRTMFEMWLSIGGKISRRIFPPDPRKPGICLHQTTVHTWDDRRLDSIGGWLIFLTGCVMLISPLWILQSLGDPHSRLGVITVFILLFLGVLSSSTLGKPFEILAATAGYSAVLVVFLQLGLPAEGL